jgi:hypothetical protein
MLATAACIRSVKDALIGAIGSGFSLKDFITGACVVWSGILILPKLLANGRSDSNPILCLPILSKTIIISYISQQTHPYNV